MRHTDRKYTVADLKALQNFKILFFIESGLEPYLV